MKLSFCLNQSIGFAKAAIQLGHEPSIFKRERAFDNFSGFKPDIVFIDYFDKTLEKAILKYNPKIYRIQSDKMLCDCPPNFNGGIFKNEYSCELVLIGNYKEEYKQYLKLLNDLEIKYKIYGFGLWRDPRYLGFIKPEEIANAYKSAKFALDLDGDYNSIFSIIKSGGFPVSIKKFNTGVDILDETRHINELPNLLNEKPILKEYKVPIIYDYLKEILCE